MRLITILKEMSGLYPMSTDTMIGGKDILQQASANADMYQQAVNHPEKAVYWKLTIEFGRMYEKMQREWCKYCIRELEKLQHMTDGRNHHDTPGVAEQEEKR